MINPIEKYIRKRISVIFDSRIQSKHRTRINSSLLSNNLNLAQTHYQEYLVQLS